jgi:hypothetical protein
MENKKCETQSYIIVEMGGKSERGKEYEFATVFFFFRDLPSFSFMSHRFP